MGTLVIIVGFQFNFLLSNLVAENRGGCILAHAPLPSGAQTVGRSEKGNRFRAYKQVSSIVCDNETSKTATACQQILLTYPSILILHEGHKKLTLESTHFMNSLHKVQTARNS